MSKTKTGGKKPRVSARAKEPKLLFRPDNFHEKDSRDDEEQLDEMVDELAEALGVTLED